MKYLIKNKYWNINKEYNKNKLLYLLVDRPDEIDYDDYYWCNNENQFHRNYDLPAVQEGSCYFAWYYKNIRQRENDKPARIYSDGYKEYWLNGKIVAIKGKCKCL